MVWKIITRRCHEPTILAAESQLAENHPAFRAVFIARFISILSLGLLGVAIPVQIQMMTHSTWQVGLSVTLTGASMFVGLMIGGVLADRYERKRLILLARGTCGIGFVGLCLNAMLPEPSLIAIYLLGIWDGLFASIGVTALLAATPALVGRENLMQAGAITMLTVRLGSVISPMIGGAAGNRRRGLELRPGGGGNLYHHADPAAFTAAGAAAAAARAPAEIAERGAEVSV
jgi:MFS family permease